MFKKAERKKAKLRLGIAGTSGSGKTWSALEIATGMGGKIAMIDTESGRGELYGQEFDYDVLRLDSPYSPERYIEAIRAAEAGGYETLIIDSLSHAWAMEGGILSIAEKSGGSFTTGWRQATPKHNQLVEAIITSGLHVIITLRTKTEYVIETNSKGKPEPKKVGMAPIQREGLEYEFTVFMDISQDHHAHITKDNTRLFDQQSIIPTKKMGERLIEWLNTGKDELASSTKLLDGYLRQISSAQSLEDLKAIIVSANETDIRHIPDLRNKLIAAKDERKKEIENAQFLDELDADTTNPPTTSADNSQYYTAKELLKLVEQAV